MSKTTPATRALDAAGIRFTLHTYTYDPSADRIGLQAAEALGADPATVLKTLMAEVDGKPVCVVLPSDKEVAMKALAKAFGGTDGHKWVNGVLNQLAPTLRQAEVASDKACK